MSSSWFSLEMAHNRKNAWLSLQLCWTPGCCQSFLLSRFSRRHEKKKLVLQEESKYPSLLLKGSEKTEIAVEAVHSPSSRTSRCTTLAVLPIPAGWHGHWPCPSHKKRSGRHDEKKDESAVLVKSYMQIIWLFYHCLFSIHETENPADFTNAGWHHGVMYFCLGTPIYSVHHELCNGLKVHPADQGLSWVSQHSHMLGCHNYQNIPC